MFIGHFAVGLASKRLAPRTNLALLLMAPLFLDLLWGIFIVAGLEDVEIDPHASSLFLRLVLPHMPWSHSLVMALVWSAALGAVAVFAGDGRRGAAVVGAGVFSHWFLDWVTHLTDLQIVPGSEVRVGLGLWRSLASTVIVESLMFLAAVWIYLGVTRARGLAGKISIGVLVAFLAATYVLILFDPPTSAGVVIKAVVATWIVVPWAWWIERTRSVV